MYGTFCNLLMVLEMSGEQAHKSLSPSPRSSGRSGLQRGMLFISSVEWDDSYHGEYFYCSVWLHLDRVRYLRWLQLLTSSTLLSAQLKRKFDFEGSLCHSNFQIGRVSNLECDQRLNHLKIRANDRPGWVLCLPMRGHSLRWALWCLDVIVSKHFEIEFVLARRASAKCTKLSVLSNCKTFYLTFWKLLRPLEWSVKSCMSAHHFLSLSFCAVAAVSVNLEE